MGKYSDFFRIKTKKDYPEFKKELKKTIFNTMRKRTIDEIKKREFLKMSELAELNGVRYSTIKFYSELGLLPFEQKGEKLAKHYPIKKASQRLKEILKMRKQGKTIPDIINHFIKK